MDEDAIAANGGVGALEARITDDGPGKEGKFQLRSSATAKVTSSKIQGWLGASKSSAYCWPVPPPFPSLFLVPSAHTYSRRRSKARKTTTTRKSCMCACRV